MEKQTNWTNVLCIVALALGFFGMCCNLFGAGSLAMSERFAQLSPEQGALMAAQIKYRPLLWLAQGLSIVQSAFLLIAASLTLRNLEQHRALLRLACKVSIGVIVLELIVNVIVQLSQAKAPLPQVPGIGSMQGVMKAATWFGIAFTVGWALAKIGFFAFFDQYLGRKAREQPSPVFEPPQSF